jgi:DUF4097 and DUF4098 domain-containing protein YvlB
VRKSLSLVAALVALAVPVLAQQASPMQTIERDGVQRVIVADASTYDVTIKGYSGSAVVVEVYGADPEDRVTDNVREGEITIAPARKDRIRSLGGRTAQIRIRVPGNTDLIVETSSGTILVETVAGSKTLTSTSGAITVRSCRGRAQGRSTTGTQRYDYVVGDVRAQSSTGAIELTNTEGAADLESATGRLWGRNVRITADSTLRSSTGRIEMDFANPIDDFTFALQSVTGSIEFEGSSARGKVQKGSGPLRITASTTTGRQSYK